ncbi:MAG: hypothetical protein DRI69_06505 [Bacteroidetes bacterium]|nr:MAG: hypothetical protein DRI69_06505 [Bacteroidota bacterium]
MIKIIVKRHASHDKQRAIIDSGSNQIDLKLLYDGLIISYFATLVDRHIAVTMRNPKTIATRKQ